ncbi:hypothetical protein [Haloferula sp. BvORR071]|uniref:hypothetical protein n=1 Tax=Haloferula sp. BvORR071 TaxID=1396141 RepID=UPI0005545BF8|nr:hypothetical protein [Haloferula sp. BvORR071]
MKGHWVAAILVLSLAACERKGESRHSAGNGGSGGEHVAQEDEAKPKEAGGDKEGPVLVEKKPPVAEPVPNMPGMVISPYNGKHIDVKGYAPGTLVADPTYPIEEKKYFRVPEMPEGANDPARLLDPGILIRPIPPKENKEPEEEKEKSKPAEEGQL